MKLVPLSELFNIEYGHGLELNKLEPLSSSEGINFVSRTSKNNGISQMVKPILGIVPFNKGLITVAVSGSVLETFLQPKPFYTAYHVMVLSPKREMSESEKLFYCSCIKRNKYRYNYGRQANKSLKNLQVPEIPPAWIANVNPKTQKGLSKPFDNAIVKLDTIDWQFFKYSDLFEIRRGRGPRLKNINSNGGVPFITSTDQNNGWNGFVQQEATHHGNVISVTRNGSVGEAFYQPKDFCATEDVHVFKCKFNLNQYIAMFLLPLIRKEKYRYNYGRKWGLQRMQDSCIKLPVKNGRPDFEFMERFIKSLPFTSSLQLK